MSRPWHHIGPAIITHSHLATIYKRNDMHVLFLIGETEKIEPGNYSYFCNCLVTGTHQLSLGKIDSLQLSNSEVCAQVCSVDKPLPVGAPFSVLEFHRRCLSAFDVVWILALGLRQSFLDKIQLLYTLPNKIRLVNSIDSLMHLKSKYLPSAQAELFRYPATYASTSWEELWNTLISEGGKWIVKPPAGSFGREVYLLSSDDSNARAILQTMTGHDDSQYCLMQRYVEEIAQGEKRILFAGGHVVGQYHRTATQDHRTNLIQGAEPEACSLTPSEQQLCQRIGQFLMKMGAQYAGVDLAYPYVIEFNVVNPGGLTTIETLTGVDLSGEIVKKVLDQAG